MSAEAVSFQGVAPAQVIINEIRANEPGDLLKKLKAGEIEIVRL